jgi:hypothetical protein
MGNNGVCKISGIGDVNVETSLGCKLTLKNVRHVSDMRLHLIFVGALDDDGYQSHFIGGKWKLLKGHLVVARGFKSGSLYLTQVKMCGGEVNAMECNSTDLWHLRLGHMSEKGILKFFLKSCLCLVMALHSPFVHIVWQETTSSCFQENTHK